MDNLQQIFNTLVSKYTDDQALAARLWKELNAEYGHAGRFYHTLDHLRWMLEQLLSARDQIKSWDTILFALFYHDIVYIPGSGENEAASATLARKRLREMAVMPYTISNCTDLILATKTHLKQDNTDINYFLDADLSILGASWDNYYNYSLSIREEYSDYPDDAYKSGRIKFLEAFLEMGIIFKTELFALRLEAQAKKNIEMELRMLRA